MRTQQFRVAGTYPVNSTEIRLTQTASDAAPHLQSTATGVDLYATVITRTSVYSPFPDTDRTGTHTIIAELDSCLEVTGTPVVSRPTGWTPVFTVTPGDPGPDGVFCTADDVSGPVVTAVLEDHTFLNSSSGRPAAFHVPVRALDWTAAGEDLVLRSTSLIDGVEVDTDPPAAPYQDYDRWRPAVTPRW